MWRWQRPKIKYETTKRLVCTVFLKKAQFLIQKNSSLHNGTSCSAQANCNGR